jgi:hypothetical protein
VTHKVLYVLEPSALPSVSPNWASSPRALAEPALNAWVGALVGDPIHVTAQVTFTNKDASSGSVTVSLKDLGLSPLDTLALARAVAQPNQASLLDTRLVVQAIGDDTTKTNVAVAYGPFAGRNPSTDRTFPEIIELLGTLIATLGGARPLAVADLLSPADQTNVVPSVDPTTQVNAAELLQRADAARDALGSAQGNVTFALGNLVPTNPTTVQALASALRTAAQIAPERAFVASGSSPSVLSDVATALLVELTSRSNAADAARPATGASSSATIQGATAMLQAIFGADFFAMPHVTPPNEPELWLALGSQAALLQGDSRALGRFIQQTGHARTQLGKYRKFSLYARALGAQAPAAAVVQLPFVPNETWLGLPVAAAPTQSRLSLILVSTSTVPDPTVIWAGFVIDSWTDIIPTSTQPTSIAFNYNSPRPNAPQAVLVVAPSSAGTNWNVSDLVATLEETRDLAKVRAVDRELLDVGQALPAIVIPSSLDVHITTFSGQLGATVFRGPFFSTGFS